MAAIDFCNKTASTTRAKDEGDGVTFGEMEPWLDAVKVTPVWALSKSNVDFLNGASPNEVKECYHIPAPGAELPDIKKGDVITIDDRDYPVSYVQPWEDGADNAIGSMVIIIQDKDGA